MSSTILLFFLFFFFFNLHFSLSPPSSMVAVAPPSPSVVAASLCHAANLLCPQPHGGAGARSCTRGRSGTQAWTRRVPAGGQVRVAVAVRGVGARGAGLRERERGGRNKMKKNVTWTLTWMSAWSPRW